MKNLENVKRIVSKTQDREFKLLEESRGLINKWERAE